MFISEGTQNLISELIEFTNSKLINVSDLTMLVEVSKVQNKERLFDDVIFTAKYLNGLGRILQGNLNLGFSRNTESNGKKEAKREAMISEDAMEKIKHEYKDNLKKFTSELREITAELDEPERNEFELKYLALTREALISLTRLIYDLAWLKTFQNKGKQK